MLRIAVDFDETLRCLMGPVCDYLNRTQPHLPPISPADVTDWSFASTPGGRTEKDLYAAFDGIRDDGTLWKAPAVDSMARWYYNRLAAAYTVDVVSHRPEAEAHLVQSWLWGHGFRGTRKIVCTESSEAKADLDYDVFVDDSPRIIPALEAKRKRLILMSKPWNRSARLYPGAMRARHWSEVEDLISFLTVGR